MTTPEEGIICWFCGTRSPRTFRGHSFPAMIESDYRLETPTENEFPGRLGWLGEGSANATICEACVKRLSATVPNITNDDYSTCIKVLAYELETEAVDVAGGLIDYDERMLRYGCWFRSCPLLPSMRKLTGLTLGELHLLGVPILSNRFITSRNYLDSYLKIAPAADRVSSDVDSSWLSLTDLIITDDVGLTFNDRIRILLTQVWILDVTLVLGQDLSFE